jgi:uncharacterized protein (TIGR03067 family)
MKRLFACIVCIGLTAFVGAAQEGKGTIEGTWTGIAAIVDGKKIPDADVAKKMIVLTIKDGKYTVTVMGKQEQAGTFKLDPKANPPAIDLEISESTDKTEIGKSQLGIFKLEGDQVMFAISEIGVKARPKDFDGGKDIEVTTFKRNKK